MENQTAGELGFDERINELVEKRKQAKDSWLIERTELKLKCASPSTISEARKKSDFAKLSRLLKLTREKKRYYINKVNELKSNQAEKTSA
jgi:hypothetical protein